MLIGESMTNARKHTKVSQPTNRSVPKPANDYRRRIPPKETRRPPGAAGRSRFYPLLFRTVSVLDWYGEVVLLCGA